MDINRKKIFGLILVYSLIIMPVLWISLGFFGMGDFGDVGVRMERSNPILSIIMFPFDFLFSIGFFAGMPIAILLLIIGCFNVFKKWGKNSCLTGLWIVFIYLLTSTVIYTIIFFADTVLLLGRFCLVLLPFLLAGYFFTLSLFRKISRIKIMET